MTAQNLTDAQIAETAYLFWLDEGQPQGRDEAHWLRAIDALTSAKLAPKAKRKVAVKTAAPKAAKAAPKRKAPAKAASKVKIVAN